VRYPPYSLPNMGEEDLLLRRQETDRLLLDADESKFPGGADCMAEDLVGALAVARLGPGGERAGPGLRGP
jgi:hypothetical protein